jgi:3-hydroxyisobutyrate dehydrogenase
MRIGVCGLGKMGSAITRRLMGLGYELTVWNRDQAKAAPLVAEGAALAATPADLASKVEMVITMVLDGPALNTVYRSPNGLLAADLTGKLVVDMSTVLPEDEAAIGAEVVRQGGGFVECPVGGTVAPALDGKLFGLAGGTDADVARARPVLEQLCRRLEHVGPVGAGARMKLAINLPMIVYWQALGEALSLCQSTGLSPERLIDILGDTPGAAGAIKQRGPDIVRGLSGVDTGSGSFAITSARKDLRTMHALAASMGLSLPTADAALVGYNEAVTAGRGDADAGQMAVHWAGRGKRP